MTADPVSILDEPGRESANGTDVASDVASMLDPNGVHFIMAEQPFVARG